jgi:hypothetical protein
MEAHANPEELRAVCRDTLAEARRRGVSVAPRSEAAEPYFAAEKSIEGTAATLSLLSVLHRTPYRCPAVTISTYIPNG